MSADASTVRELERQLPVGSVGRGATGYGGMLTVIVTEAALFAYLIFSYFYLASQAQAAWVPELPHLTLATVNTALLVASSIAVAWGERGIRTGNRRRLALGLALGLLLGTAFVGVQMIEWSRKPFTMTSNAYGSMYFTLTGFHVAHVVVGLLVLAALLLWTLLGYFGARRHAAVKIGGIYWHFVDAVWIAVYATLYLSPYLLGGARP
jgi:heme/copper-type cytochrome/quinol oxidase subunit 3